MEIIKNGLKDHILKEVEDRKQAVEEVSNRVDQIANNQIPEQYLQQAVDNYVNENNGGFATQDDLNEVKEDLDYLNNSQQEQTCKIYKNETDIFNIKNIIDIITELKETVTTDEDGNPIKTEESELIISLIRCLKTDETLTNDILPANAKVVGDKFNNLKIPYEKLELPIIYLKGSIEGMTKKVSKTLDYSFGNFQNIILRSGTCEVKWQGSSSLSYPKKNFTIVFDNEFDLSEKWGKHDKYVLKANYVDFSHARNVCSAKLWGKVVESRERQETVLSDVNGNNITDIDGSNILCVNDKLLSCPNNGAIDGFSCMLVINNEYQGLYTLSIPKDAWLLDMGDGITQSIISAEGNRWEPCVFKENALVDGEDFSIEYVTDKNSTQWVKDSINRMITSIMNCSESPFNTSVKNYIDLDSAIDYFIFIALTNDQDGVGRNFLLSTFDGVKWVFTPYDMDSVFGNRPDGNGYYTVEGGVTFDFLKGSNQLAFLLLTYEKEKFINRYNELRNTILSESNIINVFSNYIKDIPKYALNYEVQKWLNIKGTETNNISQIINYYNQRCKLLDTEISNM